jgi:hypothetical protein
MKKPQPRPAEVTTGNFGARSPTSRSPLVNHGRRQSARAATTCSSRSIAMSGPCCISHGPPRKSVPGGRWLPTSDPGTTFTGRPLSTPLRTDTFRVYCGALAQSSVHHASRDAKASRNVALSVRPSSVLALTDTRPSECSRCPSMTVRSPFTKDFPDGICTLRPRVTAVPGSGAVPSVNGVETILPFPLAARRPTSRMNFSTATSESAGHRANNRRKAA